MDPPAGKELTIQELTLNPDSSIQLLEKGPDLEWKQEDGAVTIELPSNRPESRIWVLRID